MQIDGFTICKAGAELLRAEGVQVYALARTVIVAPCWSVHPGQTCRGKDEGRTRAGQGSAA